MYQSYEQRRKFASEVLEASFFGAFLLAIEARKNEASLTQSELAQRTGREKTGISKLLSGPRNWQIRTISDLAEALDLRVEFALVDRLNPQRRFTPTGITINSTPNPYEQFNLVAGTLPAALTHYVDQVTFAGTGMLAATGAIVAQGVAGSSLPIGTSLGTALFSQFQLGQQFTSAPQSVRVSQNQAA